MTPYDTFHGDQREDHSILASLSKTNKPLPEAPQHTSPRISSATSASWSRAYTRPPQPVWPWARSAVRDKQEMGRVLGQGGRGAETTKSRDERATGSGGEARQGNHFGGRDDKGNQKTRGKNTLDETERMERPPSLRKTRVCKANRLNAFWEL